MKKMKMVCALMLTLLLMLLSWGGMAVLAEPDEVPTDCDKTVETPNADAPKEAPKTEEAKQEAPKPEEPKTETPKAEAPKQEPAEAEEEPKQEAPKTEEPGPESTRSEKEGGHSPDPDVPAEGDAQTEAAPVEDDGEAKIERQVFEITFVIDGNKNIVSLAEGESIVRPQKDPVKKGYEFVHWYDASGLEQTAFGFGVEAKRDLTLRALFSKTEPDVEDQGEANADDPDQETTIEDEEVPLASGMDDVDNVLEAEQNGASGSGRSIVIISERGDTFQYGDAVTLTAKLSGFDGEQYTLTWRHDNGSGAWTDYSHGSADCTFILNEHSVSWDWQLVAVIDG